MRTGLVLALMMIALGGATAAYEVGDTVDDFSLVDLAGNPVALSDHLGRIVVLNFFTTWCPGCNQEAVLIQNMIWETYWERGVRVVAVDIAELPALVTAWAAAQGVTYPIWQTDSYDLLQLFPQAVALPYNAVLDPSLTLRYASFGFDLLDITASLETILAEGEVPNLGSPWGGVKALYR